MKNYTRLTAMILCLLALIASPKEVDAQKENSPAQPAPIANPTVRAPRAESSVPAKSTTTSHNNISRESKSRSPVPIESPNDARVVRRDNRNEKEQPLVKPAAPIATASKPGLNETRANVCSNTASREDLYLNFWSKYGVSKSRRARREMRHCGCRGDIIFYNPTNDTLDVFFQYVGPTQQPTLNSTVLPPIANQLLIPNFFILPNDSAIFTGSCRGALQYEVVSRKPAYPNEVKRNHGRRTYYSNTTFFDRGYVLMQCMNKAIMLENETH